MTTLRSPVRTCLLTLALAAGLISPVPAVNWPQWRGPSGQGISAETALPLAWSPQDRIAWKTPIPGRGHSAPFMGSPVAFGDYVLLTSEDGETFFVKAGPSHEVVRTNSVDEPVYSSLALANGRIYIRGERHLFAIGG
jgi:hypothetical protein